MRKFVFLISIIIAAFLFCICVNAADPDFDYLTIKENHESTLPILYINVEGKSSARSKLEYKKAYMKIVPNEKYADSVVYEGDVEIKARGNATYHLPKKPYKIKLDKSTDLFGMGKSKHWVLLAQYFDESLMRNKIAYDFSGIMGLPYCESTWVDVVFNGEYIGVYQLCEQVRIGETRVDITDWEEEAESISKAIAEKNGLSKDDRKALEDQMQENLEWLTTRKVTYNGTEYKIDDYYELTENTTNGGLLFEISKDFDEVSKFRSKRYYPIMIKSPDYAYTNDELFEFARQYINAFEAGIFAKDGYTEYNDRKLHYKRLGDMESLAKSWLCAEIFCNADAAFKSRFMYLDNDGSLLKFGPVWDFDIAAGANSHWARKRTNDTILNVGGENYWYDELFNDPHFAVKVCDYYFEYLDELTQICQDGGIIDTHNEYLSNAGEDNSELWFFERGYEKDVTALKEWMTKRIEWLNGRFDDPKALLKTSGQYRPSNAIRVSIYDENTFEETDTIEYDEGCFVVIDTDLTSKSNKICVYANGIYAGDAVRLDSGLYAFYLDGQYLDEKSGFRNTVSIWCSRGTAYSESNFECVTKEKPDAWYTRTLTYAINNFGDTNA